MLEDLHKKRQIVASDKLKSKLKNSKNLEVFYLQLFLNYYFLFQRFVKKFTRRKNV